MNRRCRIAKATNTRSKTRIPPDDFIQVFHEGIHDWLCSERFEPVFDLCKCRMTSPVTNSNIEDVHVLQRRVKKPGAKVRALIGKFRENPIWRHLFRGDKNRDIGHFSSTATFGGGHRCHLLIALSAVHKDGCPSEDVPRWGQWSGPVSPATDVQGTSPMRQPASDKA